MEYSIGEVAAMLNMSRDMIRYYEKQGAVKAARKAENNYRTYDEMDVFWLLEAQQHKSWGIPISEISGIRENDFSAGTDSFLTDEIVKLKKEASYRSLLASRLEELREYMQLGIRNIGNYWVDNMPAAFRCHLVTSRGDEYERINLSRESSTYIFDDTGLPFFDAGLTITEDKTDWEMMIRKDYADALNASVAPEFEYVPGALCLVTHVDIGEIGDFKQDVFSPVYEYASSHGYVKKPGAKLRGILTGRGFEDGCFRRIVRLYLPIE